QFRGRDGDLLIGARGAIIQSECRIDQQDVEPEETEDWPSARQQKHYSGGKANAAEREHDQKKSAATQRSVWREHRRKDGSLMGTIFVGIQGAQYRGAMARKTTPARRKKSRPRKRAAVRSPRKQAAADSVAAKGGLPQWTTGEIEEAFRRFHAA